MSVEFLSPAFGGVAVDDLSPGLWKGVNLHSHLLGQGGYGEFHSFLDLSTLSASGLFGNGWYAFLGSSVTAGAAASVDGGALKINFPATDTIQGYVIGGANVAGPYRIRTGTNARKLTFEARFKLNSVANDRINAFIGLALAGRAVTGSLATGSAGEFSSHDYIGFRTKEDDGDALDFAYCATGQATQEKANIKALVADTWYKVGFQYDPTAAPSRRLVMYIDGVEVAESNFLSQTNIAAATFPRDAYLAPAIFGLAGSGIQANDNILVDWLAVSQSNSGSQS